VALPILHAHPLSSCCQKVLIAARVLARLRQAVDGACRSGGGRGDGAALVQLFAGAGGVVGAVLHARPLKRKNPLARV
jgi:hypothetical protein